MMHAPPGCLVNALFSLPLLALLACRSEGEIHMLPPDLQLTLTSPEYGEFMGQREVTVAGFVSHSLARVEIEGQAVEVQPDGRFSLTLPVDGPYRVLDVRAAFREVEVEQYVPVFRGEDPSLTWPEGVTLRLTPSAFERVGAALGAQIDNLGWADQLSGLLPPLDTPLGQIALDRVTHAPTVVVLEPGWDGLDVGVSLREVAVEGSLEIMLGTTPLQLPVRIGYDEIRITALATPKIDEDGMLSLTLGEPDIHFGTPFVEAFMLPLDFLTPMLEGFSSLIEPLGELALGGLISFVDTFELGGPFAFETDLLGMPIEARVSGVWSEPTGLGGGMGIGLGAPAPMGPLPIPAPVESDPRAHLAVGIHEGLFDRLVREADLASMIAQDIQLPGLIGEMVGNGVRNLPGGELAPEADGWCLSLAPQPAQVVRMQAGLEPMAVLYMPDVIVDIGILSGGSCDTWLQTSMAFELGLRVTDGTVIRLDILAPEGRVLYYGAGDGYDELAVTEGLGVFLEGATSLLGGQFSFDLADLLGGGLGGLGLPGFEQAELRVLDSRPMLEEGAPEGLYSVSFSLLGE